jgi:hypothetical protein
MWETLVFMKIFEGCHCRELNWSLTFQNIKTLTVGSVIVESVNFLKSWAWKLENVNFLKNGEKSEAKKLAELSLYATVWTRRTTFAMEGTYSSIQYWIFCLIYFISLFFALSPFRFAWKNLCYASKQNKQN